MLMDEIENKIQVVKGLTKIIEIKTKFDIKIKLNQTMNEIEDKNQSKN
jgi:hypothetical protein